MDNVFRVSSEVVMEQFEDGALLLRLYDLHVFELNSTAGFILARSDGQHTVSQVAVALAETCEVAESDALQDTWALYAQLYEQGIVEKIEMEQAMGEKFTGPRYARNPDVVLREEEPEEGGLLFNPDNNQVKVLNASGLFIWQQCDGAQDLEGITASVLKAFDDAPRDAVIQDVRDFIDGMVAGGFIGIISEIGR